MHVTTQSTINLGRDYHVFEQQGMQLLLTVDRAQVIRLMDDKLFDALAAWECGGHGASTVEELVDAAPWSPEERLETLNALVDIAPYTRRPVDAKAYVPDVNQVNDATIRFGSIVLMVSGACNLRCKYCYTGLQVDKYEDQFMSSAVAERAVEFVCEHLSPKHHALSLTFFGGEPLMNFAVVQSTIAYVEARAAQLGLTCHFSLTTNGTLLTRPIIEYLTAHRCGIMISFDGPPDVHDAYRVFPNGRGSHDIVLRNMKLVRDITGELHIRATRMPDGPPADALMAYFERLGIDITPPLIVSPVMETADNQYGTGIRNDERTFRHLTEPRLDLLEHEYQQMVAGEPTLRDSLSRPMGCFNRSASLTYSYQCSAFTSHMAVGPDGTLYPCHRFWPMAGYELGNVFNGIDLPAFRGVLAALHREITANCESCWARFLCGGGCPRWRTTEQGQFRPPHGYECDAIRRQWERSAGYFARMAREHPQVLRRYARPPADKTHDCGHDRPMGRDIPI